MIFDRASIEAALPGYEINQLLGTGGFGAVFAGRHVRLDRPAAVKVLIPRGDPGTGGFDREMFAAEARLLVRLEHPHIVKVYDFVERDDLCMIVMELCDAGTVRARAANGLPTVDAVAIGIAVAAALEAAHARQVVHRDVKPDNLLFTTNNMTTDNTLKVTDFGIAKIVENTGGGGGPNTVIGTPAYMAPEQLAGRALSPATDLYALGTVLFELLSGRTPYSRRASPAWIAEQHARGAVPPLPPTVPPAIATVVETTLRSDPARRPPTARALALTLADAAVRDLGQDWFARTSLHVHLPDEVRDVISGLRGRSPRPPSPLLLPSLLPSSLPSASSPPAPPQAPAPPPPGSDGAPGATPLARDRALLDRAQRGRWGLRRWGQGQREQDRERAELAAPSGAAVHELRVRSPSGVAVGRGGALLVSQPLAHRVIRLDVGGEHPVAGSGRGGFDGDGGPATAAQLDSPAGIATGPDGTLVIADVLNNRVRRVDADGRISSVATSGPLHRPRAVALGPGGCVLVADTDGHRVWRIDPDGRAAVVAGSGAPGFAGDGGTAVQASIGRPQALAVDQDGGILLADPEYRRVRRVEPDGQISTIAGVAYGGRPAQGAAQGAAPALGTDIGTPTGLCVGPDGTVYVADPSGGRVLAITPDGLVRVVLPGGTAGTPPRADPRQLAVGPDGALYVVQPSRHRITVITRGGAGHR